MPESENEQYMDKVVKMLCDRSEQLRYILTAVTNAVQERLGENIILLPREGNGLATEVNLFTLKHQDTKSGEITWGHYIFYGMPKAENSIDFIDELLRVTLDVAHELAHLVLERGSGCLPIRVGITADMMEDVREIEADWFAICILQMYGFIFPEVR